MAKQNDMDYRVKPPAEVFEALNRFAPQIKAAIPRGMGFALMIFDFNNRPTNFFYISDAERATMLQAMKEFVDAQIEPDGAVLDTERTV